MSKQLERQYPLVAVLEFSHLDFSGTDPLVLGTIPAGAIPVYAFTEITEGFDASGLTVAAPGVASFAAITAASTGRTIGTGLAQAPAGVDVTVTRSTATDVTGRGYVVIGYVLPGRQNEVQM